MANQLLKSDIKSVVDQNLIARVGGLGDDLSAGVGAGYAVLKIRASKWRIGFGGEETLITNDEGDTVPSLEVVLFQASPTLSKTYYEDKYVEGSTEMPDCWSMDGVRPDASIAEPQWQSCAACPKNAFGSRQGEGSSGRGKACADVRRIAVLPAGDLQNERYGGPMLLRVPPASLGDLAKYGREVKAAGHPYNTVVTRIWFDGEASFPKISFRAVRALTRPEVEALVAATQDTEFMAKVDRILSEPEAPDAAEAAAETSIFEQPPEPAPPPRPKPKPVAPAPAKPVVAKPVAAAPAAKPAAAKPAAKPAGGGAFGGGAPARPAPPPPAAAPDEPDAIEGELAGDDQPSDEDVDAIMASLGLDS